MQRITDFLNSLDHQKSLLILGPRGSGKTFYIQNQLLLDYKKLNSGENILTFNLLENESFRRFLTSPELLRFTVQAKLETMELDKILIVYIDEVQKVPKLLDEVHTLLFTYQHRVVFILTGSSARKLKSGGVNLLAGRIYFKRFFTLSLFEIIQSKEMHLGQVLLEQILQFGLLPMAFLETEIENKINYLKNYTLVYLKEEIGQEGLTRGLEAFSKFLDLVAQSNGAVIDYEKLSKKINISAVTIKTYYQILEDTLIATKLMAWDKSVKKQLQKSPRYYFFDNGVINALNGELYAELKEGSYRYGKLFENFVINEIIKMKEYFKGEFNIYHYRTNTGGEIDLIIEITSGDVGYYLEESFKVLTYFKIEHSNAKLIVVCQTPNPLLRDDILYISVLDFLKLVHSYAIK